MIKAGLKLNASDVYILPKGNHYLVKIRFHSKFITYNNLSIRDGGRLINYCKFHGGMNISEHRRPQLGSIKLKELCFLRLSTVGDYLGKESMVIRIIHKLEDVHLNFLMPKQIVKLSKLARKRGLLLLAGPTGSGKTTTIYYLAKQFSRNQMVMSIEDPVEIYEKDFLQLQVNQQADMTYERLLKVGLRHRPDVFIIGEIRDEVTARVAVQAALSGHLVLSTVHARSPEGVIDRLLQLGIAERYLQQCLNSVLYQRLLPSHRQMGALLNIMSRKILWPHTQFRPSLKKWRLDLDELAKKQKITQQIRDQFQFG